MAKRVVSTEKEESQESVKEHTWLSQYWETYPEMNAFWVIHELEQAFFAERVDTAKQYASSQGYEAVYVERVKNETDLSTDKKPS